MGPQEGTEHTQLLTVGQLHKSPMPETAVSEQPGHQEKDASLAKLLRSQACRRKDFTGSKGHCQASCQESWVISLCLAPQPILPYFYCAYMSQ